MKKHGKGRGKPRSKAGRRNAAQVSAQSQATHRPRAHRPAGSTLISARASRSTDRPLGIGLPRAPLGDRARALSFAGIAEDDRFALAILLAPFLIIALSLGAERSLRQLIDQAPRLVIAARAPVEAPPALPATPASRMSAPLTETAAQAPAASDRPDERVAMLEPSNPSVARPALVEPPPPVLPDLALIVEPPPPVLPSLALIVEPPPPVLPGLALIVEPPPPVLPGLALIVEPPPPVLPSLALLQPQPAPLCLAKAGTLAPAHTARPEQSVPTDPKGFGLALAAAARRQLDEFVIYNARYKRIAYPMGDVAPLFGVCTDVVVRAYRELGIDLQALVHLSRSGSGDRNIDHRRVSVVSRFLAKYGEKLPISDFPEDYQPGDIVTYYRPQNRSSTAHIAIVSDVIAPSGRLMIVHNRGWGPQLEDALFVDRITGHYRFTGMKDDRIKHAAAAKVLSR